MCLLIVGTDWGKVGVFAAVVVGGVTVVVAIGLAIYQVQATKGKARVKVTAFIDETGHIAVNVTNEKGTNTITITSISPIVGNSLIDVGPFVHTNR